MPTKQDIEAETGVKEAPVKAKTEAEEQAKAAAEVKAAEDARRDAGLIKMQSGYQTIHVHPTTVEEHIKAGWKRA